MGKVLVIGDSMLDRWAMMQDPRPAQEGMSLAVSQGETIERPGGAANVAANIAAMGQPVELLTWFGRDAAGDTLQQLLGRDMCPQLFVTDHAMTQVRTRIVCDRQQLLRVDAGTIPGSAWLPVLERALATIRAGDVSLVVFADYGKGLIFADMVTQIVQQCVSRSGCPIPVFVDARPAQLQMYRHVSVIKINEAEVCEFARLFDIHPASLSGGPDQFERACTYLQSVLQPGALIVTRGDRGAILLSGFGMDRYPAVDVPRVLNTVGAGDVFMAALAVKATRGASRGEAVIAANAAAGWAVQQPTTTVVTEADWEYGQYLAGGIAARQMSLDAAARFAATCRSQGKRIVFTNGCFDLLHDGHRYLLQAAKAEGDVLIVGYDSDASVAALKGPGRPLLDQVCRGLLLAAHADAVAMYEQANPEPLIRAIKPDVLVKGAEYRGQVIPGDDFVVRHGGRVCLVPMVPRVSTTQRVERARA